MIRAYPFAFVLTLVGAGGALAAETERRASDMLFDRLDRDRDGYLSEEELRSAQARSASWVISDRDRDGRIARSEFIIVDAPVALGGAAPQGATPRP